MVGAWIFPKTMYSMKNPGVLSEPKPLGLSSAVSSLRFGSVSFRAYPQTMSLGLFTSFSRSAKRSWIFEPTAPSPSPI